VPPGRGADKLASNLIQAIPTQTRRKHPASTHHRFHGAGHALQRSIGGTVPRHISPRQV